MEHEQDAADRHGVDAQGVDARGADGHEGDRYGADRHGADSGVSRVDLPQGDDQRDGRDGPRDAYGLEPGPDRGAAPDAPSAGPSASPSAEGLPTFDDPLASLSWPTFGPPLPFGGDLGTSPDLATAFLAALDAVDDVRFVTPPPPSTPSAPLTPAIDESAPANEVPHGELPANDLFARALLALAPAPVAGLLTMGERAQDARDASPSEEATHENVASEAPAVGTDATDVIEASAATDAPDAVDVADAEVLEDLEEFVVFSLADWRCVVPIRNVIEVGRIPEAAPVPNAPPWMHGLGNLRGQVLALIDLRAFFGVGRIKASTGRMVVLRADGDEVTAGVMVDQVHQIVALSPSRFRGAPDTLSERSAPFVWGACDYGNFTMMGLDVDGVLGVESAQDGMPDNLPDSMPHGAR